MKQNKMNLNDIFRVSRDFGVESGERLAEGEAVILVSIFPVEEGDGCQAASVSLQGRAKDLISAVANAVNTIAEDGNLAVSEVLDHVKNTIKNMKVVQTIEGDK